MNKRNTIIISIVIILVTLFVGVKQIFQEKTEVTELENVVMSDDIKTYTSDLGFSVDVPKQWKVQEYIGNMVGFDISPPIKSKESADDILLQIIGNPEDLQIEELLQKTFDNVRSGDSSYIPYIVDGLSGELGDHPQNPLTGSSFEVLRDKNLYIFSSNKKTVTNEMFTDFLSSIDWIDELESSKSVETGLVTDEACGYEVMLPEGWQYKKGTICHAEISRYARSIDTFILSGSTDDSIVHLYNVAVVNDIDLENFRNFFGDQNSPLIDFSVDGYPAIQYPRKKGERDAYDGAMVYLPGRTFDFRVYNDENVDDMLTLLSGFKFSE